MVEFGGRLFQAVLGHVSRSISKVLVGDVSHCFGHDAKGQRRLRLSHGAGKRDGDQLGLAFVLGQDDGQAEAVGRIEEHAVEPVLDVMLG